MVVSEAGVLKFDKTADTFSLICSASASELLLICNGSLRVMGSKTGTSSRVTAKFRPLANTSSVSVSFLSNRFFTHFSYCKADEGVSCFPVQEKGLVVIFACRVLNLRVCRSFTLLGCMYCALVSSLDTSPMTSGGTNRDSSSFFVTNLAFRVYILMFISLVTLFSSCFLVV